MVNSALQGCRIAIIGKFDSDTPQQIKGWIEHCRGRVTPTVDDQTTHIVISEKAWKSGSKLISDILERKTAGQKVHIMKYQWLRESCAKKHRLGENKREFSWERDEREAKMEEGKRYRETKEPRATAGLVGQVFTEYTDQYVDEREHKRIEARKKAEEEAKRQEEEANYHDFMNKEKEKRRREVAAVFRKGAQKARNEILSDNHHIYADPMGFSYDISVTKVDTRKNRNERYALTIYESNGDNPTYAVNCQFGKTSFTPINNIIVALGSNFPTALRQFKKVFKEKTGVDWENRVEAALQRSPQNPDVDFEDRPFLYHPPRYGPRGEVPGQPLPTKVVPSTGELVQGSDIDITEHPYMMSGGNGARSQTPGRMSAEAYERGLEKMKREDEELGDVYDAPFPFGQGSAFDEQVPESTEFEEETQADQYDSAVGNGIDGQNARASSEQFDQLATTNGTHGAASSSCPHHGSGKRKFSAEEITALKEIGRDDQFEEEPPEKRARDDTYDGGDDQYAGRDRYPSNFDEVFAEQNGFGRGSGEELRRDHGGSMDFDDSFQAA